MKRLSEVPAEVWLRWGVVTLVLGVLLIFDDFGVTWDETIEHFDRHKGPRTFDFWFGGFDPANAMFDTGHNPFTWFVYHSVQRLLEAVGIAPPAVDTYHALNALVGVMGVVFAFHIGKALLGPRWGLVCALGLVLTPRYLGHSFGNFKDIPFAVAWLACLWTLVLAARAPTWKHLLWHGVAFGALLTVRIGGLMFLPITGLALLLGQLERADGQWRPLFARALTGLAVAIAISYLTYPYLLLHPIDGLVELISVQQDFQWHGTTLTAGHDFRSDGVPRWYAPLWLAITLPEWILVGLVLGLAFALRRGWVRPRLEALIVCLGFAVPFAYVVVMRAPLYDGARHVLFCVPPLVLLAVMGWHALHQALAQKQRLVVPVVLAFFGGVLAVQNVQLHPFQSMWFNQAVGGVAGAQGQYTIDYWGSSSKTSARWLQAHGQAPYSLCVIPETGHSWNIYLAEEWRVEDEMTLRACPRWAHYAVTFSRNHDLDNVTDYAQRHPRDWERVHTIERSGARIGAVFRNKRVYEGQ